MRVIGYAKHNFIYHYFCLFMLTKKNSCVSSDILIALELVNVFHRCANKMDNSVDSPLKCFPTGKMAEHSLQNYQHKVQ